jgi:dihydroorotase
MVRTAKKEGVHVTCEVTPHHFTLTDEAVFNRLIE